MGSLGNAQEREARAFQVARCLSPAASTARPLDRLRRLYCVNGSHRVPPAPSRRHAALSVSCVGDLSGDKVPDAIQEARRFRREAFKLLKAQWKRAFGGMRRRNIGNHFPRLFHRMQRRHLVNLVATRRAERAGRIGRGMLPSNHQSTTASIALMRQRRRLAGRPSFQRPVGQLVSAWRILTGRKHRVPAGRSLL